MPSRNLFSEIWIPQPIQNVFEFFSAAENLEILTPPWLQFQVLTPLPIRMQRGTRLEYRLKLRGIPVRWQTEILDWEPPYRFVDRQNRGPYRIWLHTHTFVEKNDGTLVRDDVVYAVPGWLLEPVIHSLFVRPDLDRVFAYRRRKLEGIFMAGVHA